MFFDKVKFIRTNDELETKASDLVKKYPYDYKSKSDVYRAGVNMLHKWKCGVKE